MTETYGSTYPMVALSRVAEIQLGKMLQPAPSSPFDRETAYLRAGSLSILADDGERPRMWCSPSDVQKYSLRQGDLLVAEGGDVGRTEFAPELSEPTVIQNSLHRVRTRENDIRFLRYSLESIYHSGWLDVVCNKSTFGHLTVDKLSSLQIPRPTLAVQIAIADYLDAETARIDGLIAKKQRMVQLLEERMWLLFGNLVLKSDAPVAQFRRALTSITDGPFGSAFSSADYTDEGVAVVRLGNIGFAAWRGEDLAHIPMNRYMEFYRHNVSEGDLLIAGLGDERNHAGRACVAPNLGPAIVKGKCFCALVNRSMAVPEYLAMYCSSPAGADAIAIEARGSTRVMINLDIIKSVPIPLPSIAEQTEIVRAVKSQWRKSEFMVETITRQIELLQERRQALITAVVTGQLDIPEVVHGNH